MNNIQKILVALCFFMPISLFAQQKIAVVNTAEVMTSLPEFQAAQKKFQDLQKKYEADLKSMEDEFKTKMNDYIKNKATFTDLIRNRKEQELQDIEARIRESANIMQDDLAKQNETMMAPIRQRISESIKKIGDEEGYTYVMESLNMLYTGANAIDITASLIKKLGGSKPEAKTSAPANKGTKK